MKKKKSKEPDLFDTDQTVVSTSSTTGELHAVAEPVEAPLHKESLKELSIRLKDYKFKEKQND